MGVEVGKEKQEKQEEAEHIYGVNRELHQKTYPLDYSLARCQPASDLMAVLLVLLNYPQLDCYLLPPSFQQLRSPAPSWGSSDHAHGVIALHGHRGSNRLRIYLQTHFSLSLALVV